MYLMSEISFEADVKKAVETLRAGGIILYPTDTVWGIGCDATQSQAIEKIYWLKRRSEAKSMLVLADSLCMLERYVEEVPDIAYQLIEAATDPLTIVYDHGQNLPSHLLAEDGSIGIRLTSDPFCRAVMKRLHHPIVSTSANISGQIAPAIFSEIAQDVKEGVDYIAHTRREDAHRAKPSGIIRLHNDASFKILR